jgi:hypothetical protein
VLKFVMLSWQIAVSIPRIATQKMFKLLIAAVRQANLESGLLQAGIVRWQLAIRSQGWQIAKFERGL